MTGALLMSAPIITPLQKRFAPYLAGLIEGDGSIKVPAIQPSGKPKYPVITIAFALKDLPLATLLSVIFHGSIARGGTLAKPGNW
jgi:hypothetical protein